MNERRTSSILQRVPVILAVTAASYGLQLPPSGVSRTPGNGVAASSKRMEDPRPASHVHTAARQDGRTTRG